MSVTVAVLLGASKFPGYPSFGANRRFRQSKEDFLDYLQRPDRGLGVSEENVLDLFNSSSQPHAQIEEIRAFLEQVRSDDDAENNLIVYYVGHGMVPGGELLLAVQSVRVKRERYTGLSVRQLAETFKDSARNFRRFVFLDCCFAAKAVESMQASPQAISNMMAASFMEGEIDDGPDVGLRSGTALYCATDKDSPALSPDHMQRTMFTDALVSALESGHSKLAPRLTMADVNRLVKSTLKSRHGQDAVWPELHAPDQHDGDITQRVRLFPNSGLAQRKPKPTPVSGPNPTEVRELTQALAEAEQRAAAAAAESERLKDAEAALVQAFARERETAEGIVRQRVAAERADLEAKLADLQRKLSEAETKRVSLVGKTQAAEDELAAAKAALERASPPEMLASLKEELQRANATAEAKVNDEVMRRQHLSDSVRAAAQNAERKISDLEAETARLTKEVENGRRATSVAQQGQTAAEAKLRSATTEIETLRGKVNSLIVEVTTLRKRVAEETKLPAAAPLFGLAAQWMRWIGKSKLFAGIALFAVLIFLVSLTQPVRQVPVGQPTTSGPATAVPETTLPAHLPPGYIPPGRDCPYGEIKAKGKCVWNRCIGNPEREACEADILRTGR